MTRKKSVETLPEIAFQPRIVNPLKIATAVIFSADEEIRKASHVLKENMPWIRIKIMKDPLAVSEYRSEKASVFIFDDTAMTIVDSGKIRENNKKSIRILLSANDFIHRSPPLISRQKFPYTGKADLIFAVNNSEFAPEHIITSAVRCAEDRLNIETYSQERRYIFLIVDDEPRWFSQFLPILYPIIGQRADIMVTRTYEEALAFIFGVGQEAKINKSDYLNRGHGDDIICIISDIFFPKGEQQKGDAGKHLTRIVNKFYDRIPIIIASKAREADDLKNISFIMPKGDPGSLDTLKTYIYDHTGMGDFLIHSRSGEELYRIKDIKGLVKVLIEAEKGGASAHELRKLLGECGQRDCFSTWFYMHGYRDLANRLLPKQLTGTSLVRLLIDELRSEIKKIKRTPLVIGDMKIWNLSDLLRVFRTVDPEKIQKYSDNDLFSTWLDFKGYPELAEEIRPIHSKGAKLEKTLHDIVKKWMSVYRTRAGKP